MLDEYANCFIDSLVLTDDLEIDEFENFTAVVRGSSLPIFKHMIAPWKLRFDIENEKLVWTSIERGTEIDSGHVRLCLRDTRVRDFYFDDLNPEACDFIGSLFSGNPTVTYVRDNVFDVDGKKYDFGDMTCGEKIIHFEFSSN